MVYIICVMGISKPVIVTNVYIIILCWFNMMKKGQTFSIEILIVIAVLLFGVIFLVVNEINSSREDIDVIMQRNDEDADRVFNYLEQNNYIDFDEGNDNIIQLKSLDTQAVRQEVGVVDNYVVYVTKGDQLIYIDPKENVTAVGREDFYFR